MSFLPIRHTSLIQNTRAFTLLELMIVVSIIMTLMGLVLFPYNYYMQRAYVENSIDIVGQKWILAHKDIRNGKLYDISTSAHKVLVFKRGEKEIKQYLLSGTVLPDITSSTLADTIEENPIRFESDIEILGFSGAGLDSAHTIGYFIEAPYGSGAFFTGSTLISSTGVLLSIGYPGAETTTGRARQILLKPYLQ